MTKRMLKGSVIGLLYWLIYGTVETALSMGVQLFQNPEMTVLPWQWPLIAKVFGVYAVAGLVLGAVVGTFLRELQTGAALTLVLAFGANLIRAWPLESAELFALGVALLVIAALLFSLLSAGWRKQLLALRGP